MDIELTIGERILIFRRRKGLSREQLAEQCDISSEVVSKYESGIQEPDLDVLVAISAVLGVTANRLLCGFD